MAAVDLVEGTTSITPLIPPQPSLIDRYQQLKKEYRQSRATIDNYDRELKRRTIESNNESQRSKDTINSLQNELNNVRQQLEDAKALSEVREEKLSSAQVYTLIEESELGCEVSVLNEEISYAAEELGESLIYKRHEDVSQTDLDAAAAVAQEMVGEKMTNILITQSLTLNPELNSLLVKVVIQILMVKFCVSKIQSWYPGDSAIGEVLSAIYSNIRSSGKNPSRFDSKSCFA